MNKSYSKIRHIQEVNQKLENRLIVEQSENPNAGNDAKVQNLIKEGYKVVPKFNLPDGEYELSGWGYTCYVNKDGKNTGYAYVTTGGIRGSWSGKMINIVSGQIEKIMFGDVYKILFNQTEVGKPKSEL
jgi:hypothetical protein